MGLMGMMIDGIVSTKGVSQRCQRSLNMQGSVDCQIM